MFAFSTVKTLVEAQLEADHPLRGVRATMRQVLAECLPRVRRPRGAKALQIERKDFLCASLWRALHSVRNEGMLKESLRFDLRAQWFVGFCLQPDEWPHAAYSEALEAYLMHPSAQAFFGRMATYLREEGLHRSSVLALNLELLDGWADPSCRLPSDGIDLPSRRPGVPRVRDWSRFEGRRIERSLPGDAYRPGCRPTSRLGGQVSTTRALANAQLGPLTLEELKDSGAPIPACATSSRVAAARPATSPPTDLAHDDYDPKGLMQSLMAEILG